MTARSSGPLSVLIVSDGRPGHYHLSEGVVAAMARRRSISRERLDVGRPRLPVRVLATLLRHGIGPPMLLWLAHGRGPSDLPAADVVVAAGGETIVAAVAAGRLLGAPVIYCGTLRHVGVEQVALVISSYRSHADLPRHIVTLKPSAFDPDVPMGTDASALHPTNDGPAHHRRVGLLIGGNSGLFDWREADWHRLETLVQACHAQFGWRWHVSTSRRTPGPVADRLRALAGRPTGGSEANPIEVLIDYRTAGPGTLPGLLSAVDAAVVTEDSSTMLSEAVAARLPVVGVSPTRHDFKPDEREYRAFLREQDWCRFLPLAEAAPVDLATAFGETRPMAVNHLETLARALSARMPSLFGSDT